MAAPEALGTRKIPRAFEMVDTAAATMRIRRALKLAQRKESECLNSSPSSLSLRPATPDTRARLRHA